MSNINTNDKVLLALSGGVDSAVAAKILQHQGFSVEGLVISFSNAHAPAVEAAKKAANELSIPLNIAHCEEDFEKNVIQPFCKAYANGQTPNPCVLCNPSTKFHVLANHATKHNFKFIASGHYARILQANEVWHVAKAISTERDQSYMLYRLPQSILSRLCLPIGEFDKNSVRELAKKFGLSSASAPDSQEICFIPDGDYSSFIEKKGYIGKTGNFISPNGDIIAPHKGVIHYTVGQRRGLGISFGKPMFVRKILENGDILLGLSGEEFCKGIEIANIVTASGSPLQLNTHFSVKIRSMASPVACTISHVDKETATIMFEKPQRAAAPGQHAVLYDDNLVVGGGFIVQAFQND